MRTDAPAPPSTVSAPERSDALIRQAGLLLGVILLLALLLRLYLIVSTTYVWDEDREWIRVGRSIGVGSDGAYLPWRSLSHTAATAYLVRATSVVLGGNPLGYRIAFALAGVVTIWAIARLAWEWLGPRAGLLAAAVLAFNEYHIGISAFAMEKSPYLMCSALALLHGGRFLQSERTRNLYLAAVFAGLAFLFKETAALLLPVFIIALIAAGRTDWLRRRELLAAGALGLLVILPDIVWNVLHWERGYGLHSGRLEGIGFNRHFLLFFGRDLARALYEARGAALSDPAAEYPAMNAAWGLLLLGSATAAVVRWRGLGSIGRLGTILFWFVLLFFLLGRPGESRMIEETRLMVDASAWFWIDLVLPAGALLAAWAVSSLAGRRRHAAVALITAVCMFSTVNVVRDRLGVPAHQMIVVPGTVWPADGRIVDVRVAGHSCQLCRPAFRLLDTSMQDYDGRGRVPSSQDVLDVERGTDDREFRVRVTAGAANRRVYFFRYVLSDRGLPDRYLTPSVTVTRRPPPALPFWAE